MLVVYEIQRSLCVKNVTFDYIETLRTTTEMHYTPAKQLDILSLLRPIRANLKHHFENT